jgi:cinnamoyl-CoA:phenyllactate CoA-transferase
VYENVTFDLENANKRSIALDLKSEAGKAILFKLLEGADVFLTNWRPQALIKNGLDYDSLKTRFPKLVYGSLSGYGETGPAKDLPGFDFTAFFARGGYLGALRPKGSDPMTLVPGLGDHSAGLFLAAGVMAALYRAARTGKGEKVTTSLLHSSIFIQGIKVQTAQYQGYGPTFPVNRRTAGYPLNGNYETSDGRLVQFSMPLYNKYWPLLMDAVHRPDLADNTYYGTIESVAAHDLSGEVVDIISEAVGKMTLAELTKALTDHDIPFAVAQLWDEVLQDPQAWANDVFYTAEYPNHAKRTLVRQPIHMTEQGEPEYRHGPYVGEHSEEVLAGLGYTAEEVAAFHQKGAYVTWDDVKGQLGG